MKIVIKKPTEYKKYRNATFNEIRITPFQGLPLYILRITDYTFLLENTVLRKGFDYICY
ncbi:hypothetical protein [Bacillus sp. EAC]|uniref:hypothetical protein n=1 Tax=Bacillus sp. EAC TaxID=1978338 RepID=UPI001C4EB7C5|nr:hypothetical protein [Bacillus sp. EAC]